MYIKDYYRNKNLKYNKNLKDNTRLSDCIVKYKLCPICGKPILSFPDWPMCITCMTSKRNLNVHN